MGTMPWNGDLRRLREDNQNVRCPYGYHTAQACRAKKQLKQLAEELKELSNKDILTQLGNRRFYQDQFDYLLKSAIQSKQPLSMIVLNIDNFKGHNDNFGRPEGDKVL